MMWIARKEAQMRKRFGKQRSIVLGLVILGIWRILTLGTAEAIELEFFHIHGLKPDWIIRLVEIFEQNNPDITIQRSGFKNYDEILEKTLARVVAGRPPDITMQGLIYTNFVVENFAPVPLDPFIAEDQIDLADFPQSVLKLGQYEGKQMGLVFEYSVPLIFYNQDAFRKAGIPIKDYDYSPTIEEVEEWAEKLTVDTDGDGKIDQWGIIYPFGTAAEYWRHQALVQIYGGYFTSPDGRQALLDQEPAIKALEHWERMALKGYMPVITWSQAWPTFKAGKIAMAAGASSANITTFSREAQFELGTMQMAHAVKRSVPAGGNNVFILAKDPKKQKAAWKFIKWITSPEGTTIMSKGTGYLPVRNSTLKIPELMGDYVAANPMTHSALSQVDIMTPWHNWPGGTRIPYLLKDAYWEVMLGKKPARQASIEVNAKIQAVLDEYYKKKE